MQVVKLGKGESEQAEQNHPGLPSVELIMSVYDGTDEQFDC